jgi:hypothetical protein
MREDYVNLQNAKGDKSASDTVAKTMIDVGKKNGFEPSGEGGDQYDLVQYSVDKMYKPGGAGDKPNPDIEAARNRIHSDNQQNKQLSVQDRQNANAEEANRLKELEINTNKELKREEMKQNRQIHDEELAFKREDSEANRKLQREQMQMHMIETVLQILGQLMSSAMQLLGQTAAAHISGQYQVQAAIMQKFKNA